MHPDEEKQAEASAQAAVPEPRPQAEPQVETAAAAEPAPAGEAAAEPAAEPAVEPVAEPAAKPAKGRKAKEAKPKAEPKPQKAPKEKKPKGPTKESLLADIGGVLDAIEAVMAKRNGAGTLVWRGTYGSTLRPQRERISELSRQLDMLLRGTKDRLGRASLDWDKPGAADAIKEAFRVPPPGGPLTWARPCSFLLWVGEIPIRCEWAGFIEPELQMYALDPRKLFLCPEGVQSHYVSEVTGKTPAAFLRGALQHRATTAAFALAALKPRAVEAVQKFRADPANAWWLEQVARGPVEPILLPAHVAGVQRTLFA